MHRSRWAAAAILAATALTPALLPGSVRADDPDIPPAIHELQDYPYFSQLPGANDPETAKRWVQGLALERDTKLLESNAVYEEIAEDHPDDAHTYWRIARNYWRHGELLPLDEKDERLKYFKLGRDWADRSLKLDPDCGPCHLFKYASMGRIATTQGIFTAARYASEMRDLLERGIELRPTYSDTPWNTTLGNLYFAGGQFYRITPDWFWLSWVIGVRGDKEKSVEYMRKANEITPYRIDYHKELGASLLCLGTEEDEPELIEEGIAVLKRIPDLRNLRTTDAMDREHALELIASPDRACGYSRDGWIEVDEEEAKRQRDAADL